MRKIISFGLLAIVFAAVGTWALTGAGTAADASLSLRVNAVDMMAKAASDIPATQYQAF